MADIYRAAANFKEMDDLAAMHSPVHTLHPLAKLIVTIIYIFTVVSFDKYALSGLVTMALYPAVMYAVSGIPVSTCFSKLRIVLPLVCAVGLFNPFFDRTPLIAIGGIAISGGVISMLTLMLKGIFSLMASFLLIATTPIDAICAALRMLHVPGTLVTLLLLTYRYIAVMLDEVSVMTTAYRLRAPGQKGIHPKAWGSFLGQLLLRSLDRAAELYSSMQLRGFCGEFPYAQTENAHTGDILFALGAVALFLLARCVDLAEVVGSLIL